MNETPSTFPKRPPPPTVPPSETIARADRAFDELVRSVARFPAAPVERHRVPPHLRPLLPLVDRIGKDGPDGHQEVSDALTNDEWDLLNDLDPVWEDPLGAWMAGPGRERRPISDAYMQLAYFGMLLDDARTRANRRAREAAGEPPPPRPRPDLGGPRRGEG